VRQPTKDVQAAHIRSTPVSEAPSPAFAAGGRGSAGGPRAHSPRAAAGRLRTALIPNRPIRYRTASGTGPRLGSVGPELRLRSQPG